MNTKDFLQQLSWSKVNLFMQCQRCFYKEQVLRKKHPGMDPDSFSLNNAVDVLLKNEFDHYRCQQKSHPIMISNNIDAVPFAHTSLSRWRDYRAGGISFVDRENRLHLYGIVDDVWVTSDGELIVVDYKATSQRNMSNGASKWTRNSQKQLSFYASLFKRSGYKVHSTAYFLYTIPLRNKPMFNQRLDFEARIQSCSIDEAWFDATMLELRACLDQTQLPEPAYDCDYCKLELGISSD